MKYNIVCPFCGAMNSALNLLETNGSMECISCGRKTDGLLLSVSDRLPRIHADGKKALPRNHKVYRK